jgi:hypothetical protein
MKEWLTTGAALLGHIGTVGVILLLFSAGAIYVEGRGAPLPALVAEWSRAGVILGVVLTVVGALSKSGVFFNASVRRLSDMRSDQRETEESAREALVNLSTLQPDEAEFLHTLLRSAQRRFHVEIVTPALGLVSKKILVWKSNVSALEWIRELHPEIEKRRSQLTDLLGNSLGHGQWPAER